MSRLVLKMSMSLDGFVGGPDGELADILSSFDPEATDGTVATIAAAGLHIMGRRTFNDMIAYWPTSTEPFAPPMNDIPKALFSRSGKIGSRIEERTAAIRDASTIRDARGLASVEPSRAVIDSWQGAAVLTGDLGEEIARLKARPGGDIIAHGGAGFARSLVATGLIDEYRLLIHPVALGAGLALFPATGRPLHLHLIESLNFPAGAVAHVYRPTDGAGNTGLMPGE